MAGTNSEPSSREVHFVYGIRGESPFVVDLAEELCEVPLIVGAKTCLEARKLERKAFMSSTFDFSDAGRRMIDGPPFMMLLVVVSCWHQIESR